MVLMMKSVAVAVARTERERGMSDELRVEALTHKHAGKREGKQVQAEKGKRGRYSYPLQVV